MLPATSGCLPTMAIRCTTAFVDPPMACNTVIALRNDSSNTCASSSPWAFCLTYDHDQVVSQSGQAGNRRPRPTCSSKRARCSNGSFSSVYALQNSLPHMKPSKRSHRPGRERCHLASGDITCGWPTARVHRRARSDRAQTERSRRQTDERGRDAKTPILASIFFIFFRFFFSN